MPTQTSNPVLLEATSTVGDRASTERVGSSIRGQRSWPTGGAAERRRASVYNPESSRKVTRHFWIKCLDRLQKKLSDDDGRTGRRVTDVQIATSLGVSNSLISAARNGTGTLSPLAKFRILDSLGYMASRDVLCDLLPRKAAARIKKFEQLRFIARGQNRAEREPESAK